MKRLPIFFTTIVLSLLVCNSAWSESEAEAHEKAVTLYNQLIKAGLIGRGQTTPQSEVTDHPSEQVSVHSKKKKKHHTQVKK